MSKYHIGVNGPAVCRATKRACRLGGANGTENHFETKDSAEEFHKKALTEEHGLLNSSKKTDELLVPITIKLPEKADSTEKVLKLLEMMKQEYPSQHTIDFYEELLKGEIPQSLPWTLVDNGGSYRNSMTATTFGSALQKLGIYGKVFKDTANDLAKEVGPDAVILDPMAGRGWAVKALREAGIKTIASDDDSWKLSEEIENLDALESLKKYGDKTTHLLVSWAPYTSDIDAKLLRECRKNYPHITIINIGEPEGGCTGSDEFWDEAEVVSPKNYIAYQTTFGLHDRITFVK